MQPQKKTENAPKFNHFNFNDLFACIHNFFLSHFTNTATKALVFNFLKCKTKQKSKDLAIGIVHKFTFIFVIS